MLGCHDSHLPVPLHSPGAATHNRPPGGVLGQEVAWLEGRLSRALQGGREAVSNEPERGLKRAIPCSGVPSKHFPKQESIRIIIPILQSRK